MTSDQLHELENRLRAAADQLWANTGLKPAEFSTPVLKLIFLSYADRRFREVEEKYLSEGQNPEALEPYGYQAEGVLYLKPEARFSRLLDLPEGAELGKAINTAMGHIEDIEAQRWSLNPGRYVGVAAGQSEDVDFAERLEELSEELKRLNGGAGELERLIATNVAQLLEAASISVE